jgi:hypothetical protein
MAPAPAQCRKRQPAAPEVLTPGRCSAGPGRRPRSENGQPTARAGPGSGLLSPGQTGLLSAAQRLPFLLLAIPLGL